MIKQSPRFSVRGRRVLVINIVLVGGSTRIPKVQQLLQDFFDAKELCKSINPDEAVAYGAAVHAAVLSGVGNSIKDVVLVDITPLSLGIARLGHYMSVVIPKNTIIPVKKNRIYTTASDNETTVRTSVYEGERFLTNDNNLLGEFELSGFPPAPAGTIMFDVCFDIDVDGILTVSAKELSTGEKNQITIINNHGRLSEEEITRMLEEAEIYKAQDEKQRKMVQAKNALENYANNMLDILQNNGKIMIGAKERKMKKAINQTFQWLADNADVAEVSEFEEKLVDLESICRNIASKLSL